MQRKPLVVPEWKRLHVGFSALIMRPMKTGIPRSGIVRRAFPFLAYAHIATATQLACSPAGVPEETAGAPTPSESTSSGGASSGGSSAGGSGGASASGSSTSAGGANPSSGSGGAGTTPVCERPGVILCEDFEKHEVGEFPGAPWVFTATGTDGTIVVDGQTPAHSGTQSAKVSSLGNYQVFLSITGAPVFPSVEEALYVRVFLRLSEPMTGGHNTYFKAGAAGASSSQNETRVGVMNEMLMINQPDGDRGFLSNQNYWVDQLPGAVIQPETWTCIEGFFDPPNSTVAFSMEGSDISDLHVTDWKQDPLGALHFGFEQYAGPQTVLWYDDIVVSTEPIGCE